MESQVVKRRDYVGSGYIIARRLYNSKPPDFIGRKIDKLRRLKRIAKMQNNITHVIAKETESRRNKD